MRWLTLTDAQGAGIAAVTLDDPLQANVTQCVPHATALALAVPFFHYVISLLKVKPGASSQILAICTSRGNVM